MPFSKNSVTIICRKKSTDEKDNEMNTDNKNKLRLIYMAKILFERLEYPDRQMLHDPFRNQLYTIRSHMCCVYADLFAFYDPGLDTLPYDFAEDFIQRAFL